METQVKRNKMIKKEFINGFVYGFVKAYENVFYAECKNKKNFEHYIKGVHNYLIDCEIAGENYKQKKINESNKFLDLKTLEKYFIKDKNDIIKRRKNYLNNIIKNFLLNTKFSDQYYYNLGVKLGKNSGELWGKLNGQEYTKKYSYYLGYNDAKNINNYYDIQYVYLN